MFVGENCRKVPKKGNDNSSKIDNCASYLVSIIMNLYGKITKKLQKYVGDLNRVEGSFRRKEEEGEQA